MGSPRWPEHWVLSTGDILPKGNVRWYSMTWFLSWSCLSDRDQRHITHDIVSYSNWPPTTTCSFLVLDCVSANMLPLLVCATVSWPSKHFRTRSLLPTFRKKLKTFTFHKHIINVLWHVSVSFRPNCFLIVCSVSVVSCFIFCFDSVAYNAYHHSTTVECCLCDSVSHMSLTACWDIRRRSL